MFYIKFQEFTKRNTFHLLFCIQEIGAFIGNALQFPFLGHKRRALLLTVN